MSPNIPRMLKIDISFQYLVMSVVLQATVYKQMELSSPQMNPFATILITDQGYLTPVNYEFLAAEKDVHNHNQLKF